MKILWAIDPFTASTRSQRATFECFRPIGARIKATIEPVTVLDTASISDRPGMQGEALEKIGKLVAPHRARFAFAAPKILVTRSATHRAAVQTLCAHASRGGADAILVGTHARSGVPRWFLGSFAETLLLQATVPVLCVRPGRTPRKEIRHVLFPSDFEKGYEKHFARAAELARNLGSDLAVFHAEPAPVRVDASDQARRKAALLLARCRRTRLKCEVHLDSLFGPVLDRLLARAHADPGTLICMAAQSGPVRATVLGSLSRQVLRSTRCPVWIFR